MDEEKIAALQTMVLDKTVFTDAENVALELAERMTLSGHAVDDDLWQRLNAFYDEGEIVELASVIGLFNYFNRWNDALRTDITR